ncbi:hypothetical protein [Rhizobium sp. SSA_523]|nr:hypothetical protein [Rhizobium sp. SSA_523]MCO5732446.1 hypothetical protein [Rhizobium sp. SSA_523]WKC22411.1 hypothetical protein QTJ18_04535 [Rhizobium sp. SSA_523]
MQELKLEDLKKRGGGVGTCGYDKGNGGGSNANCGCGSKSNSSKCS